MFSKINRCQYGRYNIGIEAGNYTWNAGFGHDAVWEPDNTPAQGTKKQAKHRKRVFIIAIAHYNVALWIQI